MNKKRTSARWRPASSLTLRQPIAWWLLLGYLAIAAALASRVLPHPGSRLIGGFADPLGLVWWLGAALHGVAHEGNLLHPAYANIPVGESGLWNISILGLGIPLSPITALFGPVFTYNVIVILGLALNAWVAALAAARWVSGPAAAIAGAILGFGAYSLGQANAHAHMLYLLYPILLLILGTDLIRGAPPRRIAVWVTIITVWQFFISTEVLATSFIFMAVISAAALLLCPPTRQKLRSMLLTFGAGVAAAGLLLSYPLFVAFTTPTRHYPQARTAQIFSSNLANLVVPTPLQVYAPGGKIFAGNLTEGGAYLGLPLLLLIIFGCFTAWKRHSARVLVMVALCMELLSLGPVLHDGINTLPVPLPWSILQHLPLISSALPSRLSGYVDLCAAILAGIAIDEVRHRLKVGLSIAAASILALCCLLTLMPEPFAAQAVTTPVFFTSSRINIVPPNALVYTVPTVSNTTTMAPLVWQSAAHMRYRTIGAFWSSVPNSVGSVFSAWADSKTDTRRLQTAACRTVQEEHPKYVLLTHSTTVAKLHEVNHITGSSPYLDGGVFVSPVRRIRC